MLTGSYPRSLDIEDRERWPSERVLDVNFETAAERLKAAGYATFGITANPNTNATFGFDRGYDVYRDTGKLWRDGYGDIKLTAEDITGGLLSWLETRDPGQPFFAELVMIDVHEPYRTDVAVRRLSAGSDAPLPGYAYDLQLRYLDDVIGDLLGTLAALNLEDTLIVVTADHGEGLGDRSPQDQGHGPTLFDTRLKVPLILHHPGLPRPGLSISTPVELVDILPTVLDLLGVRAKASPLDGRSLLAAIEDGVEPAPLDAYVAETAFDAADASAIRSGPWKLIRDHNLAAGEPLAKMLFAIDSDPGEESDVSEDHPRIAERLLAQLEAWQQAQDARKSAAPPTRSEISPDELDALRELGYIEDRAADPN
jgi:arylsulfatase A-like enzyme